MVMTLQADIYLTIRTNTRHALNIGRRLPFAVITRRVGTRMERHNAPTRRLRIVRREARIEPIENRPCAT